MINRIGDTLIPIAYSRVEIFKSAGDSYFTFKIYDKKKKVGIYDLNIGEVITPQFDDIF